VRPAPGGRGRQPDGEPPRRLHCRPLLLRLVDPGLGVYAEEGNHPDLAASTNPTLTDRGARFSNVFRVCGRDDQQGVVAGTYIAEHLAGKVVAIITIAPSTAKGSPT